MHRIRHIARTSLLLGPLTGTLLAAPQTSATQWLVSQRQGPHATAPLGLLVDGAAGTDSVQIRSAGSSPGTPTAWSSQRFGTPSAEVPDYSPGALLAGMNAANSIPGNHVTELGYGGFSTGGDVRPAIQADGRMSPDEVWGFLSIVVADRGQGPGVNYGEVGSTLRSLTEPAGSVLSYFLEGSVGIDSTLVDSTIVEQTRAQVGLPGGAANEIAGIDWGMGFIATDPTGTRAARIAPVRDRIYFSLTQAWCTQYVSSGLFMYYDDTGALKLPNCGTIYVMNWVVDAGGEGSWTDFRVAYSQDELFGAGATNVEIDAVSVFAINPDPHAPGKFLKNRVVLSTTAASQSANQLLGYDTSNGQAAIPLRSEDGELISEHFGLNPGLPGGVDLDDITGTSGSDPELGALLEAMGTPTASPAGQGPALGIALYRAIENADDGVPQDVVYLQASGLSPVGPNRFVAFWYANPATGTKPGSLSPEDWELLHPVAVSPGSTTCEIQFPGDLGPLGTTYFRADYWTSLGSGPVASTMFAGFEY